MIDGYSIERRTCAPVGRNCGATGRPGSSSTTPAETFDEVEKIRLDTVYPSEDARNATTRSTRVRVFALADMKNFRTLSAHEVLEARRATFYRPGRRHSRRRFESGEAAALVTTRRRGTRRT